MIKIWLLILALFIVTLPVFYPPTNPFFDIDPEVMYTGNALSYIARRQIVYYDHPGTPYIIILTAAYTPLRLWAKYAVHQPFVLWFLRSLPAVYVYSRLVSAGLFIIGLALMLASVDGIVPAVILWLGLFSYSVFPEIATRISPEPALVAWFGIWFYLWSRQLRTPIYSRHLLLCLLAGITLAGKFTALNMVLITLVSGYLVFSRRWTRLAFSSVIIVAGFLWGTWPIRSHYLSLLSWATALAGKSGIHGTGAVNPLPVGQIFTQIRGFASFAPWAWYSLWLVVIIYFAVKSRLPSPMSRLIGGSLLVNLFTVIIFSKYANLYYQLTNFLFSLSVISMLSAYFPAKRKLGLHIGFLIFLLFFTLPSSLSGYLHSTRSKIDLSVRLTEFVRSHPPRNLALWDWAPTQEFAAIWGRWWSGEFYGSELTQAYPRLGEFLDLVDYRDNQGFTHRLSGVCWDQLYLQEKNLTRFLSLNPGSPVNVTRIDTTGYYLLESPACPKPIYAE